MNGGTRVLVAGGAGYVGSHTALLLASAGFVPVVVDDLSTGHADAVGDAPFERGDIGDKAFIRGVLERHRPACVMHFAAFSLVAESVAQPDRYWRNNVDNTRVLVEAMLEAGVECMVFSSSAAVYGAPSRVPIAEDEPCRPINPYGRSKLAVEEFLARSERAGGLRAVSLRYFNAAGAHPDGLLGERHEPETHLIPLVLQAASGRKPDVARYGRHFATPDGSCIRDYVHVQDVAQAHLLALQRLVAGGSGCVLNIGAGAGHSVTEVIETARRVTGRAIPVRDEPARAGDPPVLVADAARARAELGWQPNHSSLETIIAHAWQWERRY